MDDLVHEIAAEVIRQTGKDKPADAALREVLKQIKDLAPFDATEIARTVFIYYRWHVWLRDDGEAKKPLYDLIEEFGFTCVDLGSLAVGGRLQQLGGPLAGIRLNFIERFSL